MCETKKGGTRGLGKNPQRGNLRERKPGIQDVNLIGRIRGIVGELKMCIFSPKNCITGCFGSRGVPLKSLLHFKLVEYIYLHFKSII
jgi:hypothetical protein